MFVLFNAIISFGVGFVGGLLDFALLSTIYSLVVFIPSIAVAIRRVHDSGKSGWFILIPIYNFILMLIDSDPKENIYGPCPK